MGNWLLHCRFAVLLSSTLLGCAACSLLNPYPHSTLLLAKSPVETPTIGASPNFGDYPHPPVVLKPGPIIDIDLETYLSHVGRSEQAVSQVIDYDGNGSPQFAGDIDVAIDAANDQRQLYLNALGLQTDLRNGLGLTLIGLSSAAVYKGISSGSADTHHVLGKMGAAGALLFGAGTFLNDKKAEALYISGYKGITCTIMRTRPILVPVPLYRLYKSDVIELQNITRVTDGITSRMQFLYSMNLERDSVQEASQISEEKAAEYNKDIDVELHDAYRALAKARKLDEVAHDYQARIETSGSVVRAKVELIVADVANQIQMSEPDLPKLDALVTNASTITKGFNNIKPVPVAPDKTGPATEVSEPAKTPTLTPGAAPAGPASKDGAAANSPETKTPTDPASKAANGAGKSTAVTDLGKAADALSQKTDALAASVSSLSKEVNALKAKPSVATIWPHVDKSPQEHAIDVDYVTELNRRRYELKLALDRLYEIARLVNDRLASAQNLYISVKNDDPCNSGSFTIIPDDADIKLTAGSAQKFTVIGGDSNNTDITLGGVTGSDEASSVKLTVTLENHNMVALVQAGPKVASGTATLDAFDKVSKQHETVKIEIIAAPAAANTELPTAPSLSLVDAQRKLILLGYTGLGQADGIMGPKTQDALKQFQKKQGLAVTGQLDAATISALQK